MTATRLRRVLYVGQFAFFKAPHVVAEVFSRLAERRPNLELTWCCAERDHDSARALLSPAGRERVRFVGWMPQEDLVRVYDESGIFIFPSFYEGFGKVFLEAMARGLCVVASDVGGMRDLLSDSEVGRLVSVGDSPSLSDHVVGLVLRPDHAGSISSAACVKSREFSWRRLATEAHAAYRSWARP